MAPIATQAEQHFMDTQQSTIPGEGEGGIERREGGRERGDRVNWIGRERGSGRKGGGGKREGGK